MTNIKEALMLNKASVAEMILKEYTGRITGMLAQENPRSVDHFGILAELLNLKLECKRFWIDIHEKIESANLENNAVINKLKVEIEAAADHDGKKIYTNDIKRKAELDERVNADQSFTSRQHIITSGRLLQAEVDLAESIIRSLISFLEK